MTQKTTSIATYKGYTLQGVKDAGSHRELAPAQVKALIDFAEKLGLDLRRRHACIMYGRPYIEIDGLYFLAHQTKCFNGLATTPMTLAEKEAFGWDPDDYVWKAEIFRKGIDQPFVGWERFTKKRLDEKNDKGEYRWPTFRTIPDRMCEKQAERYALRKAFPELPGESEDDILTAPGGAQADYENVVDGESFEPAETPDNGPQSQLTL